MTAHKHAALMMQYAQDALETETPWERWQFRPVGVENWLDGGCGISFSDLCEYRRKPRTLTYTVTIPEPMREAPETGSWYWLAETAGYDFTSRVEWEGDNCDHSWLKRGLCFATKEDAITAAKAMLPIKGEEV